ncbi:hypothetical protein MNBD_GAMMA10-93 [hydrothermal vent metagenome]|uniref:Uncharacterized protein n=1 Tax=hydrothermal vent metagenome TaxID=652676 RepID=A0A3B0Y4P3_9ZZZZ
MLKSIFIVALVLLMSACGGGGSDSTPASTPTNPTQTFSLAKLQSTTLGTVYSTQLSGSDSDGTNYTGSISLANRAQEMLSGVLVTPRDLLLSLSGGGTSIAVTATSYVDTSNNLISLVIQTTGVTCTPVSPNNIPSSVKIGDFGILSTLVCDDNTTQESNWRIEDAGNGNIFAITNATAKDQFNAITSVTEVSYTLDSNGNIIAFKTVVTLNASSFTLTYSSV